MQGRLDIYERRRRKVWFADLDTTQQNGYISDAKFICYILRAYYKLSVVLT